MRITHAFGGCRYAVLLLQQFPSFFIFELRNVNELREETKMTYKKPSQRNPRYLSIPTLLVSLGCAHAVQMICEPLGLNSFVCMVAYLFGLALPIVIKRAFTPNDYIGGNSFEDNSVPRLPTSRFLTTPNQRGS
jgi:hypothetical protein